MPSQPAARVAVVTGTRAEYGLLRTVMNAVAAHPRLDLQVIACGMHLLPKFGRTVGDIRADGYPLIAEVRMQRGDDSPTDQADGLGRGVSGIARALHAGATDAVVVLGDRIEAMAGALAAVTVGVPVAHLHGGDLGAGDFDDQLRHAITQMATWHFPATKTSMNRLLAMGVERRAIRLVGAPGLDRLRELARRRGRAKRPSGQALVIQHAYGRPAEVEARAAEAVLRAVARAGLRRVVVYPNSDRGHAGVIRAIEAHAAASGPGEVRIVRSMARDAFLEALIESDVIVGNSSAGIIESATAGTPAVNVGDRQAGREPCGPSVLHAREAEEAVLRAVRRALRLRPRMGGPSVYGAGSAGRRVAAALATALGRPSRRAITA